MLYDLSLCELSRTEKFKETHSETEVIRVSEAEVGMKSHYLIYAEFQFGVIKKSWKWIVLMIEQHWTCLMPLNRTLKNGENNVEEIPSLLYKSSWALLQAPVIPATWEAEAVESFSPGRWRLQWAKIAPLHSSLGNKSETPSKKKKKKSATTIEFHWTKFLPQCVIDNTKNKNAGKITGSY